MNFDKTDKKRVRFKTAVRMFEDETGSSKIVMSKKRSIGLSLEDERVLSSREQRLTDFHRMRGIVWQRGVNQL